MVAALSRDDEAAAEDCADDATGWVEVATGTGAAEADETPRMTEVVVATTTAVLETADGATTTTGVLEVPTETADETGETGVDDATTVSDVADVDTMTGVVVGATFTTGVDEAGVVATTTTVADGDTEAEDAGVVADGEGVART